MNDEAHKALLDRLGPKDDVSKHFPEALPLLTNVVNFGTNLIPRVFATSKRGLEDVIVACVLLKQVVSSADAFQVLICEGAVGSASLQARSILEISLYIDWILDSDSERKAKHYYVSNLRRQRLWPARLIEGSEGSEGFKHVLDYIGPFEGEALTRAREQAIEEMAEIDRVLSLPALAEINASFEKCVRGGKKRPRPEPSWHQPYGKSSIRRIAEEIDRLPEYDTMYAHFSQIAHGSSYREQISILAGKQVQIEPIRHLRRLPGLVSYTVPLILKAYQGILKHYRPDELASFARDYKEKWRGPLVTIRSRQVRYSVTDVKI